MNTPAPFPGYDDDAADLVARTLRAVAETTPRRRGIGLAPAPLMDPPVPSRPRWLPWAGVAAAMLALASGLGLAREDVAREGGDLATFTDESRAPDAPVPRWLPAHVAPSRAEPQVSGFTDVTVEAAFLTPAWGSGSMIAATVSSASGRPLPDELVDQVTTALDEAFHTSGRRVGRVAGGGARALVALSRGGVAHEDISMALDALLTDGLEASWDDLRLEGWTVRPVAAGWLPGVAPTTSRSYEVAGGGRVEVMAMAGDLPGPADIVDVLVGAEPFVVDGDLGWRAPLDGGDRTVAYWPLASGLVGAVVDDGLPVEDVRAMAESVAPVPGAAGDRPTTLLAGASAPGDDPRWVVASSSRLPDAAARACYTLWAEGDVTRPMCGPEQFGTGYGFGNVGTVEIGDTTVVFAAVGPEIAMVTTDAPGARMPVMPTLPLEPAGDRFVVAVVDGGPRTVPSTWSFLDAAGEQVTSLRVQLDFLGS